MDRPQHLLEQEVAQLEAALRHKRESLQRLRDQAAPKPSSSLGPSIEFSTVPSDFASSSSPSRAAGHNARRHSTPRTAQAGFAVQAGHQHTRSMECAPPLKRSKTAATHTRQPSAPSMGRSRSSISAKSYPAMAFPGPSPATAPARQHSSQSMHNPLLVDYYTHDMAQPPASEMMLGHAVGDMLPSERRPQLSTLMEGNGLAGIGMGVDTFLLSRGQELPVSPLTAGSRQYLSPTDTYQHAFNTSMSTCESLTEAPTLDSSMSMSRQNSGAHNDNMSISVDLIRMESQESYGSDPASRHDGTAISGHSTLGKRPSAGDDVFFGVGASLPQPLPHEYASSAPSTLAQHTAAMERTASLDSQWSTSSAGDEAAAFDFSKHLAMERSESNTSIRSGQSLRDRAKEALNRQNKNASRAAKLHPKPFSTKTESSSASTGARSGRDGKKEISRPKYERPKHPKVKCNQCSDSPHGFRGEHELRRHTEAKHKGIVRKWICRDPHLFNVPSPFHAINPLEDCKQCSTEKRYGAYYNAAAHLRRAHFKEKPPRKNSGNKNGGAQPDGQDDRRAGRGGGDWPPMNELKGWMVEIFIRADEPGAFSDEADGGDALDTSCLSPHHPFEMPALAGLGSGFPGGDALDFDAHTYQGLPDLQAAAMDPGALAVFAGGDLISSGSADFFDAQAAGHGGLAAHGHYGSPVESSAATVTAANMYGAADHHHFGADVNPMAVHEDPDHPEFEFGLAFDPTSVTSAVC